MSLIRREVREFIPTGNLSVLFGHAEHLFEGNVDEDRRGFATVMTTLSLARAATLFREPPDAATAQRVAELLEGDPRVGARLLEVGRAEFLSLGESSAGTCRAEVDLTCRAEGGTVFIDADLVLLLDAPERRVRGAR